MAGQRGIIIHTVPANPHRIAAGTTPHTGYFPPQVLRGGLLPQDGPRTAPECGRRFLLLKAGAR